MGKLQENQFAGASQAQLQDRRRRTRQFVECLFKRCIEQLLEATVKAARLQIELATRGRRGSQELAVRRERDLDIERTAQIRLLGMDVEYQLPVEAVLE